MALKEDVISGISWSSFSNIVFQLIQYITFIVLARLLTPEDFGLIGMILVFTGFASLFRDLGFGAALIQSKQKLDQRHYSSVFWVNIITGLSLSIFFIIISPLISEFYDSSILKPLTIAISSTFFIRSLQVVQNSILTRKMAFKTLGIANMLSMAIAGAATIVLAYKGIGVWSLAWQQIILAATTVIFIWIGSDWRPAFTFDWVSIKKLLGFSRNHAGFLLINYWVRNIDHLLVGKFLSASSLGLYSRAYSLMLLPLSQVADIVGQVMFPALSRIQEDKVRVKNIYLNAISLIALITFPMMLGLLSVADSFVIAFFGDNWTGLIPMLQIFCPLGMIQSISTTLGWIYLSQGRADWHFRWILAAGSLTILSIIVGIAIGNIIAVALSYAVMDGVILSYHRVAIPGKLINMHFSEVIRSLSGVFLCAFTMSIAVWSIGQIVPQSLGPWYHLSIQVPLGIIIFLCLAHYFKLSAYYNFKKMVSEQIKNRFCQ